METIAATIEVSLKASKTQKVDFQLFGFQAWAQKMGVSYSYTRKIGFNFKKFSWTVKDIYKMEGSEAAIMNVVENLKQIVNV